VVVLVRHERSRSAGISWCRGSKDGDFPLPRCDLRHPALVRIGMIGLVRERRSAIRGSLRTTLLFALVTGGCGDDDTSAGQPFESATTSMDTDEANESRGAEDSGASDGSETGEASSCSMGDWRTNSCADRRIQVQVCRDDRWVDEGDCIEAHPLAAGHLHTCLLEPLGSVACWGSNEFGQLGNGSDANMASPVVVDDLSDAVALGAGHRHQCALRVTGKVVCWGDGLSGQLGHGQLTGSSTPVEVEGLHDAVSVNANVLATCALRRTGEVACWGSGAFGGLGNGSLASSATPVSVTGLDDAVSVSLGVGGHACALRQTGAVVCWGRGYNGQLGNGSTNDQTTPVAVVGLTDAVAITAGASFTCALRETGGVVCWGMGDHGELGHGSFNGSSTPVAVTGLTDAVSVSAGGSFGGHACAIRASGELQCWGAGDYHQLGNGSTLTRATPTPLPDLTDIVTVSAGGIHTCATDASGVTWCWGEGEVGQLGHGSMTSSKTPIPVSW
jgi:alpha-tubulin suppressor-like RCC1 family protein